MAIVLDSLAEAAGRGKAKLQKYDYFCEFIDSRTWECILNPRAGVGEKMAAVFRHLELLGLRNPSEATHGMRARLLRAAIRKSDPEDAGIALDELHGLLAEVRRAWKKKRAQGGARRLAIRSSISQPPRRRSRQATPPRSLRPSGQGLGPSRHR